VHDFNTLGLVLVPAIISLQFLSTFLNFLFSEGSYFIISGESKIGWRYIH